MENIFETTFSRRHFQTTNYERYRGARKAGNARNTTRQTRLPALASMSIEKDLLLELKRTDKTVLPSHGRLSEERKTDGFRVQIRRLDSSVGESALCAARFYSAVCKQCVLIVLCDWTVWNCAEPAAVKHPLLYTSSECVSVSYFQCWG